MFRSIAIVIFLLSLCACQDSAQDPAPVPVDVPADAEGQQAQTVQDSSVHRVEDPAQALPIWRTHAAQRPTLVLFSQDPFLLQVPSPLSDETRELIHQGSDADIRYRGNMARPNPLFFPQMTIRLALENRFFSRFVWVLPTDKVPEQLDIEILREQLSTSGLLLENELKSLQATNDGFSGTVAGVPFLAVHPEILPPIADPVVLHMDLSFFQSLYRNEIKTPVLGLLQKALDGVHEAAWKTTCVTLSSGNLTGRIPLDLRFLGNRLKTLLERPRMLDQPMPADWNIHNRALYLATFLKTELVVEELLALLEMEPNVADYHYALYRGLRAQKKGSEALGALHKAAALDPVYALEYFSLADTARKKNLPVKSLEMLRLALKHLPENALLRLRQIEFLDAAEEDLEALALIEEMLEKEWSQVYYPDIPGKLKKALSFSEEKISAKE